MKYPPTPRVPVCYNRYDTSLVALFALGKEQLVPGHLRALVPHSTASAWRKRDVTSLLGHELRAVHAEALDFHALFARHQRLRSTVIVLAKVWMHVSDIVLPVLLRNKAHGERLVNAVQLLFTVLPAARRYASWTFLLQPFMNASHGSSCGAASRHWTAALPAIPCNWPCAKWG